MIRLFSLALSLCGVWVSVYRPSMAPDVLFWWCAVSGGSSAILIALDLHEVKS